MLILSEATFIGASGEDGGDMNGDVLTSVDALMILQAAAGGIEIG